ncbi:MULTISPECIES: hypothetical protein [unclassified Streptomyces]|uniref:hypothetical protein n=1 Tax=unclassified Streptomyces TaxID=2593676 RepID=UPI0003A36130|nr:MULTISPECIES: hypothetical protein [unclassified Streptomyces]MYT32990.1 hypothetical protein [Streptomyces sp. SID8354]
MSDQNSSSTTMAAELKKDRVTFIATLVSAGASGVLVNNIGGWQGWAFAIATAAVIGGVARWWNGR